MSEYTLEIPGAPLLVRTGASRAYAARMLRLRPRDLTLVDADMVLTFASDALPDPTDGPRSRGIVTAHAAPADEACITVRQRQVLQRLAGGESMKDAARFLRITPRTVAFHKYAAMKRLRLRTNADLVRYAIAHGLVALRATEYGRSA